MNPFSRIFLLLALSLSAADAEPPGAAEYRTFTSRSSGKEVRARLLELDGANAKLRTSAGETVAIPIQALSVDDQAYIQAWNPDERRMAWMEEMGLASFLRQSGYTQTPFKADGRRLKVDVSVNGAPYEFLLETGQFLTVFDANLAAEVGGERSTVLFGEFPMPDGSKEGVYASVFESFALGETKLAPWEMGVCNLERVGIAGPGLLGADFFQANEAIIDWRKRVAFCKPAAEKGAAPAPAPAPKVGELREFTTQSGKKVLGEAVAFKNGVATLNVDGGKQVQVPIRTLSDADREYLDLWSTDPRRAGLRSTKPDEILAAEGYEPVAYGYGNSTVAAFELKLGAETLRLLINAALPVSYLDQATAARVGISAVPIDAFLMVGGKKTQLSLAKLDKLQVAGKPLPALEMRVVDLKAAGAAVPIRSCMIFRYPELKARMGEVDVDGILGLNAIGRLGALIDYRTQKMFVQPAS